MEAVLVWVWIFSGIAHSDNCLTSLSIPREKTTSLFRWVFFLLLLQYLICFEIVIITFIEGAQLAKAVFSGALFISCTSYLFVSSQWTCYFCQCTGIMRDFKGQSRLQTAYFNGGSLS